MIETDESYESGTDSTKFVAVAVYAECSYEGNGDVGCCR
jgi:hypothetical protein